MRKRLILWLPVVSALVLVVSTWSAWAQSSQVSGRCKVYRMDGRVVEGDVKEVEDSYEVTLRPGMVVRIPKEQVFKIIPLSGGEHTAEGGGGSPKLRQITAAEIEEILGSENVDILLEDVEPAPDLMAPLKTNPDGEREMERISGGGEKFETDHFLMVYTSDIELAKRCGGRLETVYRWSIRMMEMLGVPPKLPEYRLEVYFFGTFDEYRAYQSNVGFVSTGAIGFYSPDNNRCAFFDMNTWPPIAREHERLEQPGLDYRERRRITNRISRWVDHMNLEVVQHECGHQIHFNIGFFDRRADLLRWVVEGLTQQFETPPGRLGGSLGATNHYRLYQFRQLYGNPARHFPNLRTFLLSNSLWRGAESYPPAWALVHYLWKKKRAGFATYMRDVASREEGIEVSLTEEQQRFENCFGPINEEFEEDFLEFINSLQLRRSALPPTGGGP